MTTTKKPRRDKGSGRGQVEWKALKDGTGYYCARRKVDGRNPRVKLIDPVTGQPLTDRARDYGRAVEITTQLAEVAREAAPEPSEPAEPDDPTALVLNASTTVRQFGEMWTSGKLYRRFGEIRKLKVKASAPADKSRLETHVYPHIGDRPVAEVTEEECETCMATAIQHALVRRKGKALRQATKGQIVQAMSRLFDLAIKPGRLRKDNPVSTDLRPSKDKSKLYAFLYPTELLQLIACTDIPLGRRMHYVLGTYLGLRKSSLAPLTWEPSVDFEHRTILALVNKNGVPQMFEVRRDVMLLLQRWHEHLGSPDGNTPVIRDLGGPVGRDAETMRKDLHTAGITRALLFMRSAQIEPLRFHDTRATFVTWAFRAGKGLGWITDRTGHLSEEMVGRYRRSARQLEDLEYEPFPDLTNAIPELAERVGNMVRLPPRKQG